MKSMYLLALCFVALIGESSIKNADNGSVFIYHSESSLDKQDKLTYDDGKKEVRFFTNPKNPNKTIAFIPIGYYEKDKKIIKNGKKIAFEIGILQGDYIKEQIQVSNDKVHYSKEVAKRIEKEKNDMLKVYGTYTKGRLWEKPFILPLDSAITSPYGSARVFNGAIKSYHGGTDLRASIGTPVKAINDGIVALVQERFLSGNSVVINHGEGVYSVYFHLSEFAVKKGDKIKQGQVIAKSGDTGRVSGAHLHFGIVINGTNVNPIDFIQKVSAIF